MEKAQNEEILYKLRDIRDILGVTRRAVQGYEAMGLIVPTQKNARGHLLYSQEMFERIRKIQEYQWLGFTLREIQNFLDEPAAVQREYFKERQLSLIRMQKETQQKLEHIQKYLTI